MTATTIDAAVYDDGIRFTQALSRFPKRLPLASKAPTCR